MKILILISFVIFSGCKAESEFAKIYDINNQAQTCPKDSTLTDSRGRIVFTTYYENGQFYKLIPIN
jgi:hypothetical protein